MKLVECKDLQKTYGSGETAVRALGGVDLCIERGEFTAIVGASGSGKSTLLHILASVDRPTAGSAQVDGVDVGSLTPAKAALFRRRKVGLVYQFFNLIPTLTVEKNIALPLLLDKRRPDAAWFGTLVSTLGLQDKLQALPGQLSGGQQQRVAIGRALMNAPAVMLADEPTGSLDSRNGHEIVQLLKASHRKYQQTLIVVTHDENIALQADRIIAIADGRVVRDERLVSRA